MDLFFTEDSLEWLKGKGFTEKDIEDAKRLVAVAVKNIKKGETAVKIPEEVSMRVAALVYSVLSTFSEDTIWERFISLSGEARKSFDEEMEIEELETTIGKLGRIKLGRRYSDPKRKSSIKKDRVHPE